MKNKLLLTVFTAIFMSPCFAQFKCGTDEARAKLIATDPGYLKSLEQMDKDINAYIKAHPPVVNSAARGAASPQYFIPCVVHVIYDGDATVGTAFNPAATQITDAIDYINKVYDGTWTGTGGAITGTGDLQIQLVLATRDPNNNVTSGIDRVNGAGLAGYSTGGVNSSKTIGATEVDVKNISRWDPERYYNIWIVNKIDGCTGTFCGCDCDNGFVAGYAYFPMDNNTTQRWINVDGTIMLASQMKAGQKTLPHEIGHALNLYHPFEGNTSSNTCPVNTTPTTDGDKCTDTDPITNPQLAPNTVPFACRTGANACSNNVYNDNTEKNYMNYTNCYTLFTSNQKARMQASTVVTQRASLATSWANNQGVYPALFVAPKAATAVTSSANANNNDAGILNLSLNGRTVYSLNATNDGGYLNNSTKWYDAFQINPSTTYTLNVTILNNTNNSQLGVWIDLDNNGAFNNTNEQIYLNTNLAGSGYTTSVPITFTTPATWIGANNFVRMRLTNDRSTIYGLPTINNNTSTVGYGQAEDYPVYLTGGALPIKLTSFTGKKVSSAIQLNWSSSQEINAKNYLIERSVKAAAFTTIANKNALGLDNGANYSYNDVDVAASGEYLYRLKMIDQDGTFAYSSIISFSIAPQKQLVVAGTTFSDRINLTMPYNSGKASFRITDAAGRIVYNTSRTLDNSFTQTLVLTNSNLAKGIYILDVTVNGETFTKKLIKN